jgi:hypothetical protein
MVHRDNVDVRHLLPEELRIAAKDRDATAKAVLAHIAVADFVTKKAALRKAFGQRVQE